MKVKVKLKFEVKLEVKVRSKLELIQGGGFPPSDESIIEYYRYLNAHKDYNPWLK